MRILVLFVSLIASHVFAQLPVGQYFSIFGEKAAIITLDETSLMLKGGNPIFDAAKKTITLDSAEDGQKVNVVKVHSTANGSWRVIGNVVEPTRTVYAIIDVIRVDQHTLELNFNKDEYETVEEAESHLKDTGQAFGFRLITPAKVEQLMSLRSVNELTPKDMASVIRATDDTLDVLMKRYSNQPEMSFFLMIIRPPQIIMDELASRGYNPLVAKAEMEAVIAKLSEDPEVKKAREESEARRSQGMPK